MSITIQIYTIEKTLFEGKADAITLPGVDGELGVLSTHVPLISSLKRGSIRIRNGKDVQFVDITGGFVEIQPESKVSILAD
ncbi:MAG: ATP synthase F1 subunit epsilon [bacterium]|nr:ATP synthase F1 subunit epsilon [bacterium]